MIVTVFQDTVPTEVHVLLGRDWKMIDSDRLFGQPENVEILRFGPQAKVPGSDGPLACPVVWVGLLRDAKGAISVDPGRTTRGTIVDSSPDALLLSHKQVQLRVDGMHTIGLWL